MNQAYFRFPSVFQDKIVFTSEDDLWEIGLDGGVARRLTAGRGSFSHPLHSPDGRWLTFSSAEEGHNEIFLMPAAGGDLRRLTYLGAASVPTAWLDSETILFRTAAFEPHRVPSICQVSTPGGLPESLRLGPAVNITVDAAGKIVLERNAVRSDPAYWKRYRGGTAGKLWVAPSLDGEFQSLIQLHGNLSRPLWVADRVFFISDHEGVGNLFSCDAEGGDLRRETSHEEFYARNPATDGRSIVYHAGGDLHVFDVKARRTRRLDVDYRGQRTQRQRRFVSAASHIEAAALDPKGEQIALSVRGQVHLMHNWDGPVASLVGAGCRRRLACFLCDGRRVVVVVDWDNGDERLEIWDVADGSAKPVAAGPEATEPNWGRFTAVEPSPKEDKIAFSNHRNELWLLDLTTGESRKLGASAHGPMGSFSWAPDGRWIAFSQSEAPNRQHLRIADVASGESWRVTEPLFSDFGPSFDPEGRFLYFLSDRVLNPMYDSVQFGLSFPEATVPCLLTLQKGTLSPFLGAESDEDAATGDGERCKKGKDDNDVEIHIDFEGIAGRVLTFPGEGAARYAQIFGLKKKVVWSYFPTEREPGDDSGGESAGSSGVIEIFDFKTLSSEPLIGGVDWFSVSEDRRRMLLGLRNRLRVVKAGEKLVSADQAPGRRSGFLDLSRVKVLVEPAAEWRQMLHEAWRLQRDHFWREDMAKVDWAGVLRRYLPLADRINCRSEFSDLVWEMQGELGSSHAYVRGGDYRREPSYPVGFLGADFAYDGEANGYRIERLLRGDAWRMNEACPLRAPGVLVEAGDVLTAVNGLKLSASVTPYEALLHQAGSEVLLSVRKAGREADDAGARQVRVRTLRMESRARYRDWVEGNREHVRKATDGRVGYIHIPDMMAMGYAEFHRHFLRDYDREGLIVDVRYNTGGNVSPLLLEKLCRKRLGVRQSRWFGVTPIPRETAAGPMAAITNEYAGSDGDIFSHAFKLRKTGPLIGRRTWGGVIGIWPRHHLVDGGRTTQPEFSYWFTDVGWKVENYGVDPDIDVDNAPHHYRRGLDPQLDRAVEEVMALIQNHRPATPDLLP
jgi:tricorn protease